MTGILSVNPVAKLAVVIGPAGCRVGGTDTSQ